MCYKAPTARYASTFLALERVMKRVRRRARRGRRLKSYLAIGFLVFGCSVGCLLYLQPSPIGAIESSPPASTTVKEYVLKLNGAITPSSAGALMALHDGLFRREGLNVQLRHGADDAEVVSAVAVDDHVIGLASTQGFLKARADGLPLVAFAASHLVSSMEFFALSGTRLLGPADLEGKRIGYKPGLETSTTLYAFIAKNSISQSGLKIVESETAASDLLDGNIDILLGHRDIEGQILESSKIPYRTLSPDSFGVHAMGPVYFANERAFSSPNNLKKFLIAIADGWNSAYFDYDRTIPIIARSIDGDPSSARISRFMDAQRRFLRPFGARFGELDLLRVQNLQDQLLQQRVIQQPIDLTRAVNYDILSEVYRTKSDVFSRTEP
jgi:ABC-type nitrate/sulfonate/bicarbonate transport system substrate-binding protein